MRGKTFLIREKDREITENGYTGQDSIRVNLRPMVSIRVKTEKRHIPCSENGGPIRPIRLRSSPILQRGYKNALRADPERSVEPTPKPSSGPQTGEPKGELFVWRIENGEEQE